VTLATLLLLHGDTPKMEFLYFVASVLLAVTPLAIFGTIGVLVLRKIWREHHRGTDQGDRVRNAEMGN